MMMGIGRWIKKAWILLFAAASLLGCAGGNEDVEEIPERQEEEVTLDWYVNFSWFKTSWGNNLVSAMITEKTGVNINFIVPRGNEAEKFNTLINSDTLPDIITLGWWEEQIDEMIAKDMVYALNELADEYAPFFWDAANGQVVQWYTRPDGNVYCYPNSFYLPSDYEKYDKIGSNQTFLVRKDIYEAIGRPDMTTPEGFEEAVRQAAVRFPAVDGQPLIPIGAHEFTSKGCVSFDLYLQNFLAVPYEKDGLYYDRYTDPEYVAWLKVFRKLGQEGFLKEDIFIDQRVQMEEKISEGRYFCMLYQRTDMEEQQLALYAKNPDSVYIAVDGPKNSRGEDPVLPSAGINGWTVNLISKNCKDPDKAIELFSYMMSDEGQLLTYLGVEGVTYDVLDKRPVVRQKVQELMVNDKEEYDRIYGAANTYWMFQNTVRQLEWKQPLCEPNGQPEEWSYPYSRYQGHYEIRFDTESDAGRIEHNIQKLWSSALPRLLLAPSEEGFDGIFAGFVKQREEVGYDVVIRESTKKMAAAKEKLGIH